MTKTQIELAAMKQANARKRGLQFAPMLFETTEGLLLLEWGRESWNCRWLGQAQKLEVQTTKS